MPLVRAVVNFRTIGLLLIAWTERNGNRPP